MKTSRSLWVIITASPILVQHDCFLYGHRRRFFVDQGNSEGAKYFCEVWLNLIYISPKFCPQIQAKTKKEKKKGLRRILEVMLL